VPELVKVPYPEEERKELEKLDKLDDEQSKKDRAARLVRQNPMAKWILAVVALALVAGGFIAWRYYSVRESTDDAQIDGHINPISSRISGTVQKVHYDDNQLVQAGTLLIELDPKDYQVAVDRARADLANSEASATAAMVGVPLTTTTSSSQLVAADAAVSAADREVVSAQARVQEAQANYNKAASDLKRMEPLVQKDEISRQQYDANVAAAGATRAELDGAIAAVSSAEHRAAQARAQAAAAHTVPEQIRMTRARAGAAAADVQKFKAELEQAELNLKYASIVAPVTGVLSKRNVEPGQVVQPGQPLFSIVDLDDIWVTANFKETQLKGMRPGQKATIKVDAYGRSYNGAVESIGGATGARFSVLPPENATGNFVKVVQRLPVRIRFDKGQDPEHLLRPGMSVEPTVPIR
jgi:membrane fusion protein (multidrug efflux system)